MMQKLRIFSIPVILSRFLKGKGKDKMMCWEGEKRVDFSFFVR
jgi:hypothetical protein